MRKLFFALGLLFYAFALEANEPVDYFGGFYLGGSLGFNLLDGKQQLIFDTTKVDRVTRYNLESFNDSSHFLGAAYFGYGYRFSNPLYIAAEAIAELTSLSSQGGTPDVNFNIKQHNAYGGRIKVGYAQERWLLYGLAGLEQTKIKRSVNFVDGGIYNSFMMLLNNISDSDSTTIRQLGVGMDLAMNAHWAIQLEYAHIFYKDKCYPINHTLITFNNPQGTYYSSLRGNEGLIGLRYRWT